ncbi:uncharacterized protein [Ptychodera flava]|uniref:uncharacterized protein n=1 Tax=Ptychodera flava TaxID=63121 RepID=UPI00396AA46F
MINDIEDIDASSYKKVYLKKRLKRRFGDKIKFLRPHMHKCELVMAHKESDSGGRILNITHTDSESEEDEAESQSFAAHSNSQQHEMLEMIHSAMNIHATLEKAQGVAEWPPRAEDLTIQRSRDIVPTKLFNFLAWCTGLSQDFHSQERVDVQADVENKLLSICQDMMFLSSQGRKLTPKHLSLGMAVRHVTGSSSLIGLLNGLGHCVSHSKVLEHDTALAIQQLHGDGLPPGFCQEVFTTLVWDNNDFGEETLSGKGTTHNTNGIIIQRSLGDDTDDNDSNPLISVAVTKSKQRTLQVPPTNIIEYHGRPRHGPAPSGSNVDEIFQNQGREQEIPLNKDLAFWLCKTVQKLSGSVTPPVSKIGYLPVIDASPTDKSTVNTILSRSVDIANKLSLQSIVVTMDQAIYSKAQEIRWQNEEYTKRLILRLGEFHTAMSFLSTIGKRFRDAGLEDISIESGILAQGSANGVMSGHHYNRSVRCHKLVAEAMHRLRFNEFLDSLTEEEHLRVITSLIQLRESYPHSLIDEVRQKKLSNYYRIMQTMYRSAVKNDEENGQGDDSASDIDSDSE